jgi:Lrp/AsnC family leucine-responsive transcriptional regulator
MITLDQTDIHILQLLQENAKITVRDIAQQIHLSVSPVHARIKRLEETGVIKRYTAIIDFSKFQNTIMVICYVSLKEHSKLSGGKFIKKILTMPEVVECYNISGAFDFMLKVVCSNMEEYYQFHVNQLSQIENVAQVQSTFIMGVIKETARSLCLPIRE